VINGHKTAEFNIESASMKLYAVHISNISVFDTPGRRAVLEHPTGTCVTESLTQRKQVEYDEQQDSLLVHDVCLYGEVLPDRMCIFLHCHLEIAAMLCGAR
jgi:hypothetical protein